MWRVVTYDTESWNRFRGEEQDVPAPSVWISEFDGAVLLPQQEGRVTHQWVVAPSSEAPAT
jgi:hypothetical protein